MQYSRDADAACCRICMLTCAILMMLPHSSGPAYKRESVGARWGNDLIAGWGPFDFIDFANAAGIEAVMTTTSTTSVESFADLVEYCWGSSTTTKMGKQRAVDGHAEPYKVSFFELGNEGSDGAINKDGCEKSFIFLFLFFFPPLLDRLNAAFFYPKLFWRAEF